MKDKLVKLQCYKSILGDITAHAVIYLHSIVFHFSDRGRNLSAKQFDGMHHLFVRQRSGGHLKVEAVDAT